METSGFGLFLTRKKVKDKNTEHTISLSQDFELLSINIYLWGKKKQSKTKTAMCVFGTSWVPGTVRGRVWMPSANVSSPPSRQGRVGLVSKCWSKWYRQKHLMAVTGESVSWNSVPHRANGWGQPLRRGSPDPPQTAGTRTLLSGTCEACRVFAGPLSWLQRGHHKGKCLSKAPPPLGAEEMGTRTLVEKPAPHWLTLPFLFCSCGSST